jgi:hypothetical protein
VKDDVGLLTPKAELRRLAIVCIVDLLLKKSELLVTIHVPNDTRFSRMRVGASDLWLVPVPAVPRSVNLLIDSAVRRLTDDVADAWVRMRERVCRVLLVGRKAVRLLRVRRRTRAEMVE